MSHEGTTREPLHLYLRDSIARSLASDRETKSRPGKPLALLMMHPPRRARAWQSLNSHPLSVIRRVGGVVASSSSSRRRLSLSHAQTRRSRGCSEPSSLAAATEHTAQPLCVAAPQSKLSLYYRARRYGTRRTSYFAWARLSALGATLRLVPRLQLSPLSRRFRRVCAREISMLRRGAGMMRNIEKVSIGGQSEAESWAVTVPSFTSAAAPRVMLAEGSIHCRFCHRRLGQRCCAIDDYTTSKNLSIDLAHEPTTQLSPERTRGRQGGVGRKRAAKRKRHIGEADSSLLVSRRRTKGR